MHRLNQTGLPLTEEIARAMDKAFGAADGKAASRQRVDPAAAGTKPGGTERRQSPSRAREGRSAK